MTSFISYINNDVIPLLVLYALHTAFIPEWFIVHIDTYIQCIGWMNYFKNVLSWKFNIPRGNQKRNSEDKKYNDYEWAKHILFDKILHRIATRMMMTNGTYPWIAMTYTFRNCKSKLVTIVKFSRWWLQLTY